MADAESLWEEVRKRCERLEPGSELSTPVSERPFRIDATHEDRLVVRFADSGERRTLWRSQYELLADRLEEAAIPLSAISPAVEPYATVLTLTGSYLVEDEALAFDPDDAVAGESPYLIAPEDARTAPERVHDDALLLADSLDRLEVDAPDSLATDALTDLYVLLSDVQSGSDRLRQSVREPLLERLGPDQELHGRFGTVRRTRREYRRPKAEETVLEALDDHGVPHEWVLGVDPDKLGVVVTATDLTEEEVYDVDEQVYVQKTGVDEREKFSRLQGLVDRLDELDEEEGETFRRELAEFEDRLEEALSAD